MDREQHKRYFGYDYRKKNTYAPGAKVEEHKKVSRHIRYVTRKKTGPLKCNCQVDENGLKCNKRSRLDGKGKMIDEDACPNLTFNYECQAKVCGPGCRNQALQEFNATRSVPPVYVGNAGLYGLGLFASQVLHPGEVVGEYVGEIRCQKKRKLDVGSHYAFGLGDGFPGKFDLLVDAKKKGNYMRYGNHSCYPNCSTQQIIVGKHFHIIVKANQVIPEGTQVTISYGKKFFDYGAKCFCGTERCISKM